MGFEMGRPRKDDELELEKRLEERRKFLERKYKEDLELVEKCFYEENQIKMFLWFKGYECAVDAFNEVLNEMFSLKD